MPVAAVTSILANGLLPMFITETAPATTEAAADMWAGAYADYIVAGGIPDAATRRSVFAAALVNAFRPELAGAGPPIFIQAFQTFWLGLAVPAQAGVVTAFIPSSTDVDSPQSDDATPNDQAMGLAQVIASLTLGSVKVFVPPGVLVPLA